MTAPPGGPYGPDPSGNNPYGPGSSWGGQPQPGPQQYPPGAPGYPPQQYPPGGWPGGPYPYGPPPSGPPPKRPGSKMPWLIGAGIAVLIAIALVVTVVLTRGGGSESTQATPTSNAGPPPSASAPQNSAQNATDCTPNVSPGSEPNGDSISAGALSFPASAAPGWMAFGDRSTPNAIGALGVAQEVPGAVQWIMQAEVATTNFVSSMDIATQASKLMTCLADGPGYADVSPTLGPTKTSSIKVDGTDAARVEGDVTIADTSRNVKGDSVVIITVKTTPVTFFYGATPIGDADARATIDGIIAALKVTT